jgi:hypothetical protein
MRFYTSVPRFSASSRRERGSIDAQSADRVIPIEAHGQEENTYVEAQATPVDFTASTDDDGILTREELLEQVRAYETQFGMTSDQFLRMRKAGTAPDTFETIDWAILLKYK